jgi:hypothetical protein
MNLTERIRAGRQTVAATPSGPALPVVSVVVVGDAPHGSIAVREPVWRRRAREGLGVGKALSSPLEGDR